MRVLEPLCEGYASARHGDAPCGAGVKDELLNAAHPSPDWLYAELPGTCAVAPCAVAPCMDTIEVVSAVEAESTVPMSAEEEDVAPLSARSLKPALPALPRFAPPCLPRRAPSGDAAVDAAERLLARVVDPFGAME
mmetsp:Transcript_90945/g.166964  ORF Transcript_90945/g.166964 Transcript_90945/m.166964 type:complete len:136 (+) Transcript_90945:1-408(+)